MLANQRPAAPHAAPGGAAEAHRREDPNRSSRGLEFLQQAGLEAGAARARAELW